MTGEELARLMVNRVLKATIAQHARRYSKDVENQEEFIQDAWFRISKHPGGQSVEYYGEQGRKAIEAEYRRRYRRVDTRRLKNVNGISTTGKEAVKKTPVPKRAIHLYLNKHLDPKPEILDWEFYKGHEADVNAERNANAEWYKQSDDFATLSTKEQNKLINRLKVSGYRVGQAIGGTYGKKSRHYKVMVDYKVDENGVVEPTRVRAHQGLATKWPTPAGGPVPRDAGSWRALRELGGPADWVAWLDDTIEWIESGE